MVPLVNARPIKKHHTQGRAHLVPAQGSERIQEPRTAFVRNSGCGEIIKPRPCRGGPTILGIMNTSGTVASADLQQVELPLRMGTRQARARSTRLDLGWRCARSTPTHSGTQRRRAFRQRRRAVPHRDVSRPRRIVLLQLPPEPSFTFIPDHPMKPFAQKYFEVIPHVQQSH